MDNRHNNIIIWEVIPYIREENMKIITKYGFIKSGTPNVILDKTIRNKIIVKRDAFKSVPELIGEDVYNLISKDLWVRMLSLEAEITTYRNLFSYAYTHYESWIRYVNKVFIDKSKSDIDLLLQPIVDNINTEIEKIKFELANRNGEVIFINGYDVYGVINRT